MDHDHDGTKLVIIIIDEGLQIPTKTGSIIYIIERDVAQKSDTKHKHIPFEPIVVSTNETISHGKPLHRVVFGCTLQSCLFQGSLITE